ncbi:MAG: enoyl-ACP reductase [Steroidobacteraceae bacterium]
MGFLAGKKVLIVGLATDRSIAWGISQAMRREGAELALTYQNERIKDRVLELANQLGSTLVMPMDVGIDAEIDAAFARLRAEWGALDVIVHSVAYAPREALTGGFVAATTREAFAVAHDVSSYSLTALARAGLPLMEGRAGAIVTLSYLGAVRSIPSYNVMGLAKASLEANVRFLAADLGAKGIRVNAISAGPIKTLAAAGIPGFRKMLHHVEQYAPLKRNVTTEDVGNAAAFLCSDLAAGITGETLYVDSGYSHVGMSFPE